MLLFQKNNGHKLHDVRGAERLRLLRNLIFREHYLLLIFIFLTKISVTLTYLLLRSGITPDACQWRVKNFYRFFLIYFFCIITGSSEFRPDGAYHHMNRRTIHSVIDK